MSHPLFEPDQPGGDRSSMAALRAYKPSMVLHRRLMLSLLSSDEIHPAQAGCLQAVVHHDGMSQSDLAEMLHVSRPTVTTMLQRMEAGGLIVRRPDESDTRITRVYITDAGRTTAERMREVLVQVLQLSLGSLPEADRAELTRLLEAVNTNMESALAESGAETPRACHGHGHETEERL